MSEKERIVNKIREDKTRHINFDESFGGSENQFRLLMKYVPDAVSYTHLTLPTICSV